jgi:hypothetical protein
MPSGARTATLVARRELVTPADLVSTASGPDLVLTLAAVVNPRTNPRTTSGGEMQRAVLPDVACSSARRLAGDSDALPIAVERVVVPDRVVLRASVVPEHH